MLGFAPTQCTHGRRCRRAGARCPVAHAAAGPARRRLRGPRCGPRPFAVGHRAPSTGRQPSPRRDAFRPVANRRAAGRECAVERPAFARAVRPRSTRCDGRARRRAETNRPFSVGRSCADAGRRFHATAVPDGRHARRRPPRPTDKCAAARAVSRAGAAPGRCGRMRNKRRRRARTGVDLSQAPRRARREPDRNGGSPIRRPS